MKKNDINIGYHIAILALFIGIIYFYLQYASEPLLGWYGSREVQTAITAYWFDFHHLFKSLFFYETPLFGSPWSIPFEFPLFQLGAAGIHSITGIPLDKSGRWLSTLLYFCCFIPLYKIIKEIDLDKEYFYISAILILLSPIYLYWSRAFLIESSALLTGFLFLWASIRFSKTNHIRWIFWIFVFGVLCSLIKITTFPSFVLAAFFSLVMLNSSNFSAANIRGIILKMVPLFVVLILCSIAVKLWTEQADDLKLTNEIGRALTSKNLQG
ncbi:MAG: glycosyltransferase family 39 protein [Verrucomicrobia bacterium]|nr:MAG: glycosyltransferase family 39 protein [Verrucomicrobiota bacterium]